MAIVSGVIASLVVLFIVVFHESAHALVAAFFNYKTKAVYIGLPITRAQIRVCRIRGADIILTPWLIGAGVNLDYEDSETVSYEEGLKKFFVYQNGFWQVPAFKKTLIMLAGPMANFLLALIILISLVGWSEGIRWFWVIWDGIIESVRLLVSSGPTTALEWYSPIGVVAVTAPMIEVNPWLMSMILMAVISIAFGIVNLLPLPAFDGGHIVMAWWIELWQLLGFNKTKLSKAANTVVAFSFLGFAVLALVLFAKDLVWILQGLWRLVS